MIWALHGNLGSPEDWAETRKALEDQPWRSVNLWESKPGSFEDWSEEFLRGVQKEAGERVLVGYSLGARLGMHAFLRHPEAWSAAIFVSGHPGLKCPEERESRLQIDREWARKFREENLEELLGEWNAQPVFGGERPGGEQRSRAETFRNQIAAGFEAWSLGRQRPLGNDLVRCSVPQLWVAGEKDPKFEALARGMASANPQAHLEVISGCGHRVLLQKPGELASCLRRFLKSHNLIQSDVENSCRI